MITDQVHLVSLWNLLPFYLLELLLISLDPTLFYPQQVLEFQILSSCLRWRILRCWMWEWHGVGIRRCLRLEHQIHVLCLDWTWSFLELERGYGLCETYSSRESTTLASRNSPYPVSVHPQDTNYCLDDLCKLWGMIKGYDYYKDKWFCRFRTRMFSRSTILCWAFGIAVVLDWAKTSSRSNEWTS